MAVGLSACDEDNDDFSAGSGTITPSVTVDPAIVSPVYESIEQMGFRVPDASEFSLKMTDASGRYSGEWASVSQFSPSSLYRTGEYLMEAFSRGNAEGFSDPLFAGSREVVVVNSSNTPVNIKATVAAAIITVDNRCVDDDVYLTFHSSGGSAYLNATGRDAVLLAPGDIEVYATLKLSDGREAAIYAAKIPDAKAAHHYIVTADIAQGCLSISWNGSEAPAITPLDDALFAAKAPEITASGFDPNQPLRVVEGATPDEPVTMRASGTDIVSLTLTSDCQSLNAEGLPVNIDLMSATAEQLRQLEELGIAYNGEKVDFTAMIPRINLDPRQPLSTFTLLARDRAGRVSEPAQLKLLTIDSELEVVAWGIATVGVGEGSINVRSLTPDIEESIAVKALNADGVWAEQSIIEITPMDDYIYNVSFTIPEGTDDLPVQIFSRGRLKAQGTIRRVSPMFKAQADMYSRGATIKIDPLDTDQLGIIVALAHVYDGDRELIVFNRDAESGMLEIIGLEPSKHYDLRVTVIEHPNADSYYASCSGATENAEPLPNGDFEDTVDAIKKVTIPSGGRYSQTIVDIFNHQNSRTFNVQTPKGWATANEKTFCQRAHNQNTWYMQPSAMSVDDAVSGAYAALLVNTAWDIDGEEIPDYAQISQPYISYNPNIPHIAHRAAGRMWLGSYSFNPATGEEVINEGISFSSRPSTLTGVYRYMPGNGISAERALVEVKVWGRAEGAEILIGSGRRLLPLSPDNMTFNVPISYSQFGVKATKICVILSASSAIGSIDYETANVMTWPDAVTASSTGNRLWVDNLNFAY